MDKLIARISILYLSKLYQPGEELPASDPGMVEAWIENNAAAWKEKFNPVRQENITEENYEKEVSQSEQNDNKDSTPPPDDEEENNNQAPPENEEEQVSEESSDEEDKKEVVDTIASSKEEEIDQPKQPITRRNKK